MSTTWFSRDLGHRHCYGPDGTAVIEMAVIDELCVPGTRSPRIAVLATIADIATGSLVQPAVAPWVPLTVDLDVHIDGVLDMDQLVCTARAVKLGRTIQVLDATFADGSGRTVGASTVRFIRSPEPSPFFDGRPVNYAGVRGRMVRPFAEQLDARVDVPGQAMLHRWEYVLQPTGTIQGGAITLLAELAAESALGVAVTDIDVHFLSAVREGPARAVARPLWGTGAQVEVRDEGNGNRLVASATALGRPK